MDMCQAATPSVLNWGSEEQRAAGRCSPWGLMSEAFLCYIKATQLIAYRCALATYAPVHIEHTLSTVLSVQTSVPTNCKLPVSALARLQLVKALYHVCPVRAEL